MNNTSSEPVEQAPPHSAVSDTIECSASTPPGERVTDTPQRIGDFTIIGVLGEGGMGTVYLAEDVRLGRKAAIKTMKRTLAANPETRLRFVREARAAAAVEHDNIVPVWQVGEAADGSPFIAMPFLHGEMLEARLRREPIQPLSVILKVACEVTEGLTAAHAQGLIHRDIKPGNVWIEGDPEALDLARQVRRCKILDFGLARSQGSEDVQITASGTVLGTPAYMPPEQASGEMVDQRADLFSLGAMLYRMSSGQLPFAGLNTIAVLHALATVTPPPARTLNKALPQALSDLIDRLLSKHPAGRPQSAAEVAMALQQIVKKLQARNASPVGLTPVEDPAPQDQTERLVLASAPKVLDNTMPFEPQLAPKPGAQTRRVRTRLLVVLGLLALLPLGWWLATVILRVETANGTLIVEMNDPEAEARIKGGKLILTGPDDKVRYTISPSKRDNKIDAGPYKIRVEGADGLTLDTPEFTLKKDGKVTVRVTVDPGTGAKSLDPDRRAAIWVLSIGGTIKVNGQHREIKAAADLPSAAFRVTWFDLHEKEQVSDAGLAHFKDCKSLIYLGLQGTQVSDVGLVHFKNCKDLTHLDLKGTQVSGAGLVHFKDCKDLTDLSLGGTPVTDTGLASLSDCKSLMYLGLQGTKVSNAGLAYFKDCKDLTSLFLDDTQVSDAGLGHLKGCMKLTYLSLPGTQVSDAGLAYFKDCKSLTNIDLSSTQVGDAGLDTFKDCKSLTRLDLQKTKVTAAKVEELKKALPGCKIEWDER